ncbi:MAG TPA: hypothetical protein VJL39_00625 [Candidatus Paceibacterota bacterium]
MRDGDILEFIAVVAIAGCGIVISHIVSANVFLLGVLSSKRFAITIVNAALV